MVERRKVSFALMIANFDIFENYDTFNRIVKRFFSRRLGQGLELRKVKRIEEELMIYLKTEKNEVVRAYIKKLNNEIKVKDIGIFPYVVYSDPTLKIKIDTFNKVVFNVARAFYPHTFLKTIPPFILYALAKYIAQKYDNSIVFRVILSHFVKVGRMHRKVEEVSVEYPKGKYLIEFLGEYEERLKGKKWIKGISIKEIKEGFSLNIKRNGVITIIDRDPFERFYEIFKEPILYLLEDASRLRVASKSIERREDIVGIKIFLLGEDITFATLVEDIIEKMSNISYFITTNVDGIVGSLELIDKESGSVFSIIKLRKKEIFIAPQSYATIPSISRIVDEFRNKLNGKDIEIMEKIF